MAIDINVGSLVERLLEIIFSECYILAIGLAHGQGLLAERGTINGVIAVTNCLFSIHLIVDLGENGIDIYLIIELLAEEGKRIVIP